MEIRLDRNRLDQMMALRELDKKQLADAVGVHEQTIYKIRREQSTSLGTLERLCDALECHPFDLIVAEGYPPPFSVAQASP